MTLNPQARRHSLNAKDGAATAGMRPRTRQTLERLDSFVAATVGRRITYKELTA